MKITKNIYQKYAKTFEPGQVLFKEGEQGDYFYIVDSGSARVSDLTGKLDVTLQPGSFFGEEALVGDTPRNASVIMESDGVLMRLGKQDFKALLQDPVLQYIDVQEFQSRSPDSYLLLDVRLPLEYRMQHVPGSRNLPLASLRSKLEGLDSECDSWSPMIPGAAVRLPRTCSVSRDSQWLFCKMPTSCMRSLKR